MENNKQKKVLVKVIVYFIFTLLVAWVVYEPIFFLKMKDGMGILVGVFLIHTSIENMILLKKVNIKCENQSQVIEQIFKNCPDLIVIKDSLLRVQACNDAMMDLIGIKSPDEIKNRVIPRMLPKDMIETIQKYEQAVLRHNRVVKFKVTANKLNNHRKIYEVISAPMMVKDAVVGILSISRDITAKEELKQQLMEKQFQLTAILNNLPYVAYLKDLDGKIIRGNSKLEGYLNMPFHKIMGHKSEELFFNCSDEYSREEDEEVVKNKTTVEIERKVDMANRGLGWYRVIKSPILNEKDEVTGITVLIENIDEERKIEAQKETFVATLTHDLKTPTIAQIRALELLTDNSFGEINGKQKEMLEQILKSCRYMLSMISHVLSTYKFENGETKLRNSEFNFKDLVDECTKEVSHLAQDKSLKFIPKFDIKDATVKGDRIQLKRVLINILSNAISYAFDNTEIGVTVEEKGNSVSFYTVNESQYIPSDILNRIFDKYVSGPSVKFNKVGTGLGLYLSERIINAHNGSIIARSTKDNKNTFGFIIPKSKDLRCSCIEA